MCYITVNDDDSGGDVDRCTLTLWRMGYRLPRDIISINLFLWYLNNFMGTGKAYLRDFYNLCQIEFM